MPGKFITFEGTDGSGKTSIIKEVERYLKIQGYNVVTTREPGGVSISEQVRNVIHDNNNTDMDAVCEALLYAAARRQHLVQKVVPLLKEGKVVFDYFCREEGTKEFEDAKITYPCYEQLISQKS